MSDHIHVEVDATRCQGHQVCTMFSPDVFDLREDDGHAFVRLSCVPSELVASVRRAALNCPEQAIVVTEAGCCERAGS